MSKTTIFVAACSIGIIILFIVFCYLMSIVDSDMYIDNGTITKSMDMRSRVSARSHYLYPNDELSSKDNVHYGLEKVPEDYDFKITNAADDKLNAEFENHSAMKNLRRNSDSSDHEIQSDSHKSVTLMIFPIKENTRTTREKRLKNAAGESKNVVLKFVDDTGQARMEVIVDSGQLNKKGFSKIKKELGAENIYEIKPNNTLLYDINDQSFVVVDNDAVNSDNNSFKLMSRVQENFTNALTAENNVIKIKRFDAIHSFSNSASEESNIVTKNVTSNKKT